MRAFGTGGTWSSTVRIGLSGLVLLGAVACQGDGSPAQGDPVRQGVLNGPPPSAVPVPDPVLEAELRAILAGFGGEVGVAVEAPEQGHRTLAGAERPFPLASVYKLGIAYALLRDPAVGPGDSIRVDEEDRAPGNSPLVPGRSVPLEEVVERSLAHSDNTASDALLRRAGGPAAVLDELAAGGLRGFRVDRTMVEVFAAWRRDGEGAFAADGRDTGTAEGVTALLMAVHDGVGLSPPSRELLLTALESADTGPNRIRAGVPAGTWVAHKTGTLGPWTHDAGLIRLPGDRGVVALSVLIESDQPVAARERLIQEVARAVWERYAFAPPDSPPPDSV
jgi:beta-lactamase class A